MQKICALFLLSFLLFSFDLASAGARTRGNQRQRINKFNAKKKTAAPKRRPSQNEKLVIEATPPDSSGVSTNEIPNLGFSRTPEFRVSSDTKVVHLKASVGEWPFLIENSHDIKIDRPVQNSEKLLLIIEHPQYIGIQNSTFTGVDVRFISKAVEFLGLGVNATNSIDIRSPLVRFNGPIISDALSVDGEVKVSSPVVARTATITNGGTSEIKGSIDVADALSISGNNIRLFGRLQGEQLDLRATSLEIEKIGQILGQSGYADHGKKVSVSCTKTVNRGGIFSEGALLVMGDSFENANGIIKANGDLTFRGASESEPMSALRSNSGQIMCSGKMRIFSDLLRISPQEIPQIESASTVMKESSQPVNAHCPGLTSRGHQVNANEITRVQTLSAYTPALVSAKGGIDFHVRLIENVLSRIETAGDVWIDESLSPNIVLDALYTTLGRQLNFHHYCVAIPALSPPGHTAYSNFPNMNQAKHCKSIVIDHMRSLGCQTVSIQPINDQIFSAPYECKKAGDNDITVFCHDQMIPHAASMVYGGAVFGKASSMKLRQWSLPANANTWLQTTSSDTSWRKEQITVQDQIIRILPNLDILNILGTLKLPAPKTEGVPGKLWADSSGYNGLSADLDPYVEYMAINYALSTHIGQFKITPHELLRNSAEMIRIYNLQAGQCPTDNEIAAVTVPFLCSGWTTLDDGRQILIPIAIIPKAMIAEWRSREAAQFEGDLIDLTIEGDARIDGAIRSIKEGLRLKAKNLVLTGLAEGKDVNLEADNSLLLQSIHDEISGHFKATKIKSQGNIELKSGEKLTAIATEMVGNNIVVRSEGQLAIIPVETLESFKREFVDEGRVTIEGTCKKFFGNNWQAFENLDISSAQDMYMEGGSFKADNIGVKSDQGNVNIKGLVEECRKLYQKSSGGLFWSESIREETKTKNVVQTKFEATQDVSIQSAKDTNLCSVNIQAANTTIHAGESFNIQGDKSSVKVDKERHSSHFLSFGRSGRFYLLGGEGETSHSYDEKVIKSQINSQILEILSGKKTMLSGVDISVEEGIISGENGVYWSSLLEEHRRDESSYFAGLWLSFTNNVGELSLSVNLGGGESKEHSSAEKQTSDNLLVIGNIKIDGKNEGFKFVGVNQAGKVQYVGKKGEISGTKSWFCLDGEQWEASVGLKAGARSRLTKALANVFETTQTNVAIVEDGVNLGFKILKDSVELISGILLPLEFGIWVTGEVETHKKHQCFETVAKAQGNFFSSDDSWALDFDVLEDLLLNGVDFEATSARIEAKSFVMNAMEACATHSETSAGVFGEVNLQGVGEPSASANANTKQGSSTVHHSSKLNVAGKLQFDISGRAEFRGAQVKAGELYANFGDLLLMSLQNSMQATAAGASISVDPTRFDELSKLLTGVGASGLSEHKAWISDVTDLLGVNVAKVVVKNTVTLIAAVIANAERDENGKLTDKGNLELSAANVIYEDVLSAHKRFGLGLSVSRGPNKAVPGTVSGDLTLADKTETTRATIGKGNVTITENPECLNDINRDAEQMQHTEGVEIQPIRFYVPIVSPENMGDLWAELGDAVNHPIDHVVRTFKRNMKAMTWFTEAKDWTPENDARWRHLLDRLRIVGEEPDAEINEVEEEVNEAKAEAVKDGDENRQKELLVAEKSLAQAKAFGAANKVFSEDKKSEPAAKVAKTMRDNDLNRAKRIVKGIKLNDGSCQRTWLEHWTFNDFQMHLEPDTVLARERQIFLEFLERRPVLEIPELREQIHSIIDRSRALERAGHYEEAYNVMVEFEHFIQTHPGFIWPSDRINHDLLGEFVILSGLSAAGRLAWESGKLAAEGGKAAWQAGKKLADPAFWRSLFGRSAAEAGAEAEAAKAGMYLSKAKFGHTFTKHGEEMTTFLIKRSQASGMPQGQFLNNQEAARLIASNLHRLKNGAVEIALPQGFPARIIYPDGTFGAATKILIVPGGKGVRTAYPIE